MENTNKTYSAASFDSFSAACPFFTSKTDVNNGYGCLHTSQAEYEVGEDGIRQGKCYCWSCPLGIPADDESLTNLDINWDGNDVQPGDVEGEYLLIRTGKCAIAEEKHAWHAYQRYINRYNK